MSINQSIDRETAVSLLLNAMCTVHHNPRPKTPLGLDLDRSAPRTHRPYLPTLDLNRYIHTGSRMPTCKRQTTDLVLLQRREDGRELRRAHRLGRRRLGPPRRGGIVVVAAAGGGGRGRRVLLGWFVVGEEGGGWWRPVHNAIGDRLHAAR